MYWGNGFCRHCGQIGKPREERPPKGKGGKGKGKHKAKNKSKPESESESGIPPPPKKKQKQEIDLTNDEGVIAASQDVAGTIAASQADAAIIAATQDDAIHEGEEHPEQEDTPPPISHRIQSRRRRFWDKLK